MTDIIVDASLAALPSALAEAETANESPRVGEANVIAAVAPPRADVAEVAHPDDVYMYG